MASGILGPWFSTQAFSRAARRLLVADLRALAFLNLFLLTATLARLLHLRPRHALCSRKRSLVHPDPSQAFLREHRANHILLAIRGSVTRARAMTCFDRSVE